MNGSKIESNHCTRKVDTKCSFDLKAVNAFKSVSRTIDIDPVDCPDIQISLSKKKLRKGNNENAELKWNVKKQHPFIYHVQMVSRLRVIKD